jgi:hypothetical protein
MPLRETPMLKIIHVKLSLQMYETKWRHSLFERKSLYDKGYIMHLNKTLNNAVGF